MVTNNKKYTEWESEIMYKLEAFSEVSRAKNENLSKGTAHPQYGQYLTVRKLLTMCILYEHLTNF